MILSLLPIGLGFGFVALSTSVVMHYWPRISTSPNRIASAITIAVAADACLIMGLIRSSVSRPVDWSDLRSVLALLMFSLLSYGIIRLYFNLPAGGRKR